MGGASASLTAGCARLLRVAVSRWRWRCVVFVVGWLLELVRFAAAQLPAVDGVEAMSVVAAARPRGALDCGDRRRQAPRWGWSPGWQRAATGTRTDKTWQAIGTRGVARAAETTGRHAARRLAAAGGRRLQHPHRRRSDRDRAPAARLAVRHQGLPDRGRLAGGRGRRAGVRGGVVRAHQGRPVAQARGAHASSGCWWCWRHCSRRRPVGVLLLTGALVATVRPADRHVAAPPDPGAGSRAPRWCGWCSAICGLLGVAYSAMGPVGLPRVVVATPERRRSLGGYVGRGSEGVDIATCTALADATSTDTRLRLVPDHGSSTPS